MDKNKYNWKTFLWGAGMVAGGLLIYSAATTGWNSVVGPKLKSLTAASTTGSTGNENHVNL